MFLQFSSKSPETMNLSFDFKTRCLSQSSEPFFNADSNHCFICEDNNQSSCDRYPLPVNDDFYSNSFSKNPTISSTAIFLYFEIKFESKQPDVDFHYVGGYLRKTKGEENIFISNLSTYKKASDGIWYTLTTEEFERLPTIVANENFMIVDGVRFNLPLWPEFSD